LKMPPTPASLGPLLKMRLLVYERSIRF
jgi:hypothetical protein